MSKRTILLGVLAVLTLALILGIQPADELTPSRGSNQRARFCPLRLSLTADARAAEPGGEATELAKKSQNPVADLISLPFQYNVGFNVEPYDRVQSVLNIQPVVPIRLTEDWNLITRTILPLIKQPEPLEDKSVSGTVRGMESRPCRDGETRLGVPGTKRTVPFPKSILWGRTGRCGDGSPMGRSFFGGDDQATVRLRQATRTGRPAGGEEFIALVEGLTGRDLRKGLPGRPGKAQA